MEKRWSIWLIGTLGLVGLTCGACSSSSSGGVPFAVSPGHGSPEAAAAGVMTGIQRNQPSLICEYLIPADQSGCSQAVTSGTAPTTSVESWSLGKTVVDGDQAIVVVVYKKLCESETCFTSSNPAEGIPTSTSGFAQEYSHAVVMATSSQANNYPALPMLQVDGQWYANDT